MMIEISMRTSTSKQSSEAGMVQVQPVVKMDGLEGVDALGTPIRHPEACRRWRFERKEGSPEVGCEVVLLATV